MLPPKLPGHLCFHLELSPRGLLCCERSLPDRSKHVGVQSMLEERLPAPQDIHTSRRGGVCVHPSTDKHGSVLSQDSEHLDYAVAVSSKALCQRRSFLNQEIEGSKCAYSYLDLVLTLGKLNVEDKSLAGESRVV